MISLTITIIVWLLLIAGVIMIVTFGTWGLALALFTWAEKERYEAGSSRFHQS